MLGIVWSFNEKKIHAMKIVRKQINIYNILNSVSDLSPTISDTI